MESILDLRIGFRLVELLQKDIFHDLKVEVRDLWDFGTGFSGNFEIPGVLKSSLSDSPLSITYNYIIEVL